jgi:hypothetical protein
LDPAQIRYSAHQAVEGIDFSYEMAFSKSANGRITGHSANGNELVSNQARVGAHPRGSSRSFATGVATANHHDIESASH